MNRKEKGMGCEEGILVHFNKFLLVIPPLPPAVNSPLFSYPLVPPLSSSSERILVLITDTFLLVNELSKYDISKMLIHGKYTPYKHLHNSQFLWYSLVFLYESKCRALLLSTCEKDIV